MVMDKPEGKKCNVWGRTYDVVESEVGRKQRSHELN